MRNKLTHLAAVTLAVSSFNATNAQQAVGLYAGNHNTPYSAFQNPANVFPDKNRVYVNFWGANLGFTSNFLNYNAPFGLVRMLNGEYPDAYKKGGHLAFDQDWVTWDKTNSAKLYYLNEVYGPSVNFRAGNRVALGFGLRGISGVSLTGLSAETSRLLRYGLDTNGLAFQGPDGLQKNTSYSNGAFSMSTQKYQEWYFSLGGVTRDRGPHFVKWGGNAKLLLGTGAAGLHGDGFTYAVNDNNQLQLSNVNAQYYHTDELTAGTTLQYPLGLKFDFLNGAGAGFDLGFMYEYRPNKDRKTVRDWWTCADEKNNDYDWKFGASLTDIGFIAYNGDSRKLDYTGTKNWNINKNVVNQHTFLQGTDDRFAKVDQGFFDDTAIKAGINDRFTVTTPMALNAQLDLKLANKLYLGFNWTQNLKAAGSAGLRKTSYVTAVPRWETEHAEIGVPITLTRDYSALNVGLYGRLGPVILGTDNLAGLASFMGNKKYNAANLYFAVRMQIQACDWRVYQHETYTDTVIQDSVHTSDTLTFWEKDTVYIEKIVKDTVRIQKTDTVRVVEYRKLENGGGTGSGSGTTAEELRKKEDALKKKEEDLRKREAILTEKETKEMGKGTDCDKRIADLEEQLRRERELYTKLNTQYQDCRDERERINIRIVSLERELDLLRGENTALKTQNTDLQNEIIRLKGEITRLKANSKPCGAQVKTLDSLLTIEQGRNDELRKENSRQKAEVQGKTTENEDLKKKIAALEEEIRKLKAAAGTNAEKDVKILDLEKQLSDAKAKVTGIEKQLEDLRKEYQFEIQKNKDLEAKLKNCGSNEESAKLKAELEAQKKKCDDLDAKIKALEAENTNLKSENSSLKAKVTALEKDVTELTGTVSTLNKKIADLEEQLKNCGDAAEMAKLKAEIDALKKSNSEKDAQISALKNDKSKLESDLSTAKAKITDLENQLKECQGKDCGELEEELAQYKLKYDNAKAQYDAVYAEYNALLADYNKLKSQLADCEQKLKNCSSNSDDISKLEAEIAKMKATIIELNGQVASKQKSLDELQEAYDKSQTEKATLQKEVNSLQGQVKSLNARITALEEELKLCKEAGNGGGGSGGN